MVPALVAYFLFGLGGEPAESKADDDACPGDPECNSGSVYVFERTGSSWTQTQKLTASDGGSGDQAEPASGTGNRWIDDPSDRGWSGYSPMAGGFAIVVRCGHRNRPVAAMNTPEVAHMKDMV